MMVRKNTEGDEKKRGHAATSPSNIQFHCLKNIAAAITAAPIIVAYNPIPIDNDQKRNEIERQKDGAAANISE